MGTVYRARDLELDEIVALKMLRRDFASHPKLIARFRQEVKRARRVTHKNVARTFDIGEHGSDRFLTMELIDGESLGSRLARHGPFGLNDVVDVGRAICAGLSAAHAVGVVHRDLKPQNVLVARDARVVITDFGIARIVLEHGDQGVGTTGFAAIGTPAYMAPEQVEGAPDIDGRADIYALGVTLFELVTGTQPWRGRTILEVASKRLLADPPDVRDVTPTAPPALAEIILKSMARDREGRWASADELEAALASMHAPSLAMPARAHALKPRMVPVKAVAVLPFRNAGPEADAYLADGFTDDLIDNLSMIEGLRVCSRGVVDRPRGGERDPRDIGVELHVQAVVDGSVRRVGDLLRVTARVIGVQDGFQLWAKRIERPEKEFLQVGDLLAQAVADALTMRHVVQARETPLDPDAIDLYLRARHEYHQYSPDHIERAQVLFEKAVARAPNEPLILSGYAMALQRRFFAEPNNDALLELGRSAAERALVKAPRSGEPHAALARYFLNIGAPIQAARETKLALRAAPGLADGYDLAGRLLCEAGDADAGIAHLERALASEPRMLSCRLDIGRACALVGRLAESDEHLRAEPDDPGLAWLYWMTRARIALWFRQIDHGREWLARTNLGEARKVMLVLTDRDPSALEPMFEEHLRPGGRGVRRRAVVAQLKTEVCAFLGDVEGALAALGAAEAANLVDLLWLERCPLLEPVRADGRVAAIAARMTRDAADVRAALA